MSTLDLVQAIMSKDAMAIESSFNDVMADKISTRLEDMRTTVAQNMFKTPEAVVEEAWDPEQPDGGGAGAGDVSSKDKKKKSKAAC
jgi:hypothetical protein